ncbi:hypothetical protein J2X14_003886 [Pantoea alhagi]|uniref:hypothetical protein n=1 Tax=Mixta sp. BE291 TaxID=3158787 RepID=UPI00285CC41A|nr:hypothetical protein [Pantoea alhagi]
MAIMTFPKTGSDSSTLHKEKLLFIYRWRNACRPASAAGIDLLKRSALRRYYTGRKIAPCLLMEAAPTSGKLTTGPLVHNFHMLRWQNVTTQKNEYFTGLNLNNRRVSPGWRQAYWFYHKVR